MAYTTSSWPRVRNVPQEVRTAGQGGGWVAGWEGGRVGPRVAARYGRQVAGQLHLGKGLCWLRRQKAKMAGCLAVRAGAVWLGGGVLKRGGRETWNTHLGRR